VPSAAALDRYAGRYRLPNGRIAEVRRQGTRLIATADTDSFELLPQGADAFYLPRFAQWVEFERDASGKVTGLTATGGGNDFTAPRQD
jgi:hypothetical protein